MDNGDGEFSEIHSSNAAHTISQVNSLQPGPDAGRGNTQRTNVVATFVMNLSIGKYSAFAPPPLEVTAASLGGLTRGVIHCRLEHTERGTEGEVTDSIEREVSAPWRRRSICLHRIQTGWSWLTREGIVPDPLETSLGFHTQKTLLSAFSEFVPLSDQCFGVKTNVRLILKYALEGEDVRDHLVLCVGRDHGR